MRRVLSIWLPRLAIERWAKTSDCAPDLPVVLTVEGTHGPIIHAVTKAAAERGARPGARLTDARALDPGLVAVPADPAGDAALVARLARWASRWSPLVEVDGPDGLRLDVTGVAHLFGGEAGLDADVRARFAGMGLTARLAVAPTAGAAWALARFALSPFLSPSPLAGEGGSREAAEGRGVDPSPLSLPSLRLGPLPLPQRGEGLEKRGERGLSALLVPLPVAALRLSPQSIRTLERLGLKRIGDLAGIERRALARRFRDKDNPLDALDRALGRKPEPLTAAPCETPPRETIRLEEPATHPEAASQALHRLIPGLVRQLERRRLGARRLALTGFRVDGSIAVASVATSIPSREPKHLARLLADKVAAFDPGFGVDAFALEASWAEPLGAAQQSLVEEPDATDDIARLVDRLSVKLGPDKVRRPAAMESHVPERASGWASAVSSLRAKRSNPENCTRRHEGHEGPDSSVPSLLRAFVPSCETTKLDCRAPSGLAMTGKPQRLLDRPETIAVIYATPEGLPRRFVWRRAVHDIARVEGPERIAPEWWRERSTARLRDYYRVEDLEGRRYWIFREGLIGDGRGGAPAWYLHGLFG